MTTFRNVKVRTLKLHQSATLPTYGSAEAAGADLYACLEDDVILMPGERRLIPTGIAVELPEGYELQVRPRSGLALKHGLTIVNSPGTVDSDYRGDVSVMLLNTGHEPFVVKHEMRIAQAIIAPVVRAQFEEATSLADSARGTNGFGSTGV